MNLNSLKWFGTVTYLIGMFLTAFNFYPYNLLFGVIGGMSWFIVGWYQKDLALKVVELASAGIYMAGLIYWTIQMVVTPWQSQSARIEYSATLNPYNMYYTSTFF